MVMQMSREKLFKSKEYEEFIKTLDIENGKYKRKEVFKDLITLLALRISDTIKYDENNEKYCIRILEKYNEKEREQFGLLSYRLTKIYKKSDEIIDILGHIYTDISMYNKELKQDFTPIDLAKLMTEIQVELKSDKEIIKQNGFMTIEDNCCGSGGFLLEKANCLEKEGIDPSLDLLVIANDIDPICAYMTYIQLYIYSIPGVVTIGNSLQLETRETFYTHRLLAIDLGIEKKDIEEKEIEE